MIGGFTAQIGDPSGKSEERPLLKLSEIQKNISGLEENLKQIFQNFGQLYDISESPTILNNYEWCKDLKLGDFLYKFGKNYKLSDMLGMVSHKMSIITIFGHNF